MAEKNNTPVPEDKSKAPATDKQTGTPAPEEKGKAPTPADKAQPAAPDDKGKPTAPGKTPEPPAPAAGGKDDKAPADKGKAPAPPATDLGIPPTGKITQIEFPSGKSVRFTEPGKAAPAPKEQADQKKTGPELTTEGDSLDQWDKEQQEVDAKKPGRKPRAGKTADQPDKPAAKRGRPKKEQAPSDIDKAAAKTAAEVSAELKKREAPPPAKSEKAPADRGNPMANKDYRADFPPTPPPSLRVEAPRPKEPEQIVHINIAELHPFKNHPFGVRDDKEMRSLVESVKDKGVHSPALVRPREGGGYEIVAGHRRQRASELAGYKDMPCIVREMTDDEAILAMTDDNLRQRSEILPSEKAFSLKMQVEAINHRGERNPKAIPEADKGKKSIQIVGERNDMTGKQVQRYVRLTELVPDLLKAVDEKKVGFTPAIEFSFIKPKNQRLIAVNLDGEQASPSLSQAKQLRELDQKGQLNGDVIDSILSQEKKEVDKVILSGNELTKYFGNDKTPRQMKDKIIELLEDMKAKEKAVAPPDKKIKAPEK